MEDLVKSPWRDRRVLLTGATGLVGSWLCRHLLGEGAAVTALVRDQDPRSPLVLSGLLSRCFTVRGCLEDYASVERALCEAEADTVVHLGAQSLVGTARRSPLGTFESNIRGTYHVLEACRVHGDLVRRVVVASSDKAYGESEILPYHEDLPMQGRHPYDVSKSCADLIAQSYAHSYGLPVTIARCGNIYGGGDLNWSRLVPATIRAALQGQPVTLRSDGTCTRDYLYVEDAARALMLLCEKAAEDGVRGQGFNFSPGHRLTVMEMVKEVLIAVGRPDLLPVEVGQAAGEIRDQVLDATRARERLGWAPRWTLSEGLRHTVDWYRAFLAEGRA